jgi:hypothetical protein
LPSFAILSWISIVFQQQKFLTKGISMKVLYVSDAARSSLPMRILCAISRHAFTTITRDRLAFLPSGDRCKFDVVLIDSKGVAREDLSRAKADLFPYISCATPILEIGRGAI